MEDLDSTLDIYLTMLEIKLDVVASDVRGHGDDRRAIKLANEMACRYTVQIRHNDVHQNQIVFGAALDFVHSLQAVKLLENISNLVRVNRIMIDNVPRYQ